MAIVRSTASARARWSRLLRVVAVIVRVFLVVVSFELSGAAAVIAAVCEEAGDDDGCCPDCPLEKDGNECPPGCPSCHCSHAGLSLPPVFAPAMASAGMPRIPTVPAPHEASVPRAPPLRSVYRPPRPLLTVS